MKYSTPITNFKKETFVNKTKKKKPSRPVNGAIRTHDSVKECAIHQWAASNKTWNATVVFPKPNSYLNIRNYIIRQPLYAPKSVSQVSCKPCRQQYQHVLSYSVDWMN